MKSLNTLTKQANKAADRWTEALIGESMPDIVAMDSGDWRRRARVLARAAFLLYSIEWNGSASDFNIREWAWPFGRLDDRNLYPSRPSRVFDGLEPWSVLFRRAVELEAR